MEYEVLVRVPLLVVVKDSHPLPQQRPWLMVDAKCNSDRIFGCGFDWLSEVVSIC
jgi:hypothetical protein